MFRVRIIVAVRSAGRHGSKSNSLTESCVRAFAVDEPEEEHLVPHGSPFPSLSSVVTQGADTLADSAHTHRTDDRRTLRARHQRPNGFGYIEEGDEGAESCGESDPVSSCGARKKGRWGWSGGVAGRGEED